MRNKLYIVLVFHILLLLFQLAFRQLILDTTFVRDFGLFVLCFIFYGGQKEHYKNKDILSSMIRIYLLYGFLMSVIHIIDGVGTLDAVVTYRNHFFPFILFFIAVYLLRDSKYRKKWVDFLYVVFIILLADVYIEKLMDIAGISRGILPWYQYQFTHYYRFIDTEAGARIVDNPEQSPILGLLGWNNPTACAITALFSFFLPFLLKSGIKQGPDMPKVACLATPSKVILFVLTIGALAILTIKTPFFSLAFVFLLYLVKGGNNKSFKTIIVVTIITVIVAYFTFPFWGETFMELMEETEGEYGMSYIFDQAVIAALLSSAFSGSPLALLFGTDITNNSMYSLLEVRIIVHTIQFGVIWLIIYGMISFYSIKAYNYIQRIKHLATYDQLMATGAFLLIVSYLVDFLHYAHAMFLFHYDIFVVSIALLVAIKQRGVINES